MKIIAALNGAGEYIHFGKVGHKWYKCKRTLGEGPDPSPPRSDRRRTWLAVMPSVTCCDGSECFRVSRHGDNKYGLSGDPGRNI